jgi:uncharacterized lipoprotein YehR (DUF1307 family)
MEGKIMKKLIVIVLTLALAIFLAACGGNDNSSTNSPANNSVKVLLNQSP